MSCYARPLMKHGCPCAAFLPGAKYCAAYPYHVTTFLDGNLVIGAHSETKDGKFGIAGLNTLMIISKCPELGADRRYLLCITRHCHKTTNPYVRQFLRLYEHFIAFFK